VRDEILNFKNLKREKRWGIERIIVLCYLLDGDHILYELNVIANKRLGLHFGFSVRRNANVLSFWGL